MMLTYAKEMCVAEPAPSGLHDAARLLRKMHDEDCFVIVYQRVPYAHLVSPPVQVLLDFPSSLL